MRQVTVTLGETEYTIKQQRHKAARQWRAEFMAAIGPVMGMLDGQLSSVIGQAQSAMVPESIEEARRFDWQPLAGVIGQATGLVSEIGKVAMGSIDTAADLLFAYDPDLAMRREEIEETAYDDQIVAALLEVVKLAYPIQPAMKALSMAGNG